MPLHPYKALLPVSTFLFAVTLGQEPAVAEEAVQDAPPPNYQLEAGTGVKLIDIGAGGMKDLSDAVKRLNAPREAPSTTSATPETTESTAPPETPPQESNAAGNPAKSNPATAASTASANEHPSWLMGKWGTASNCQTPKASKANSQLIEVMQHQATFGQQRCDIKAISVSQTEIATVLYHCIRNGVTTQESYVFKKVGADKLLLNYVEELMRC